MEKVESIQLSRWHFATKRAGDVYFVVTMARGAKEDTETVLFAIKKKNGNILVEWGVNAHTGEVFRCDACDANEETITEMETYLKYEIKGCLRGMCEEKIIMAVGSNFRIPREVMG